MPKRKQGEVDNEGVQDFELIELLIRETRTAPSTSTQQGSDFESFKARFQSYIDQVPSYLHSVGKEGFFPHFFLGSFSTLVDTEIATKLNIEKVYFSFDSAKTLKVAVIKKGEIKSPEDAADKVRLFVIAESGSTKKKFSYGELDKILGNTKVARNNIVRLARDQGKLGVRLVEITKEKDDKGKMAGISINVESNKLDNDASTTHEFKEIKKGVWNNPESDIAKLTNSNVGEVEKSLKEILKKVNEIHSEHENSLAYAQGTREAAHHGFIAGALMNFRYRHNLRVYLEQFAGRGYADIVLVPRGKDRSLNAVPIIIELKAGTAAGTTPGSALEQAKDYAKGFQPNTMRVLTVSDNVLCVGLNLDSTEGEKFSMHISPREDREIALPTMQALLKEASDWDGGQDTITNVKEKIKQPLERIYHTFPGTPEKGGNYFSRFLLGQLLLANEFERINLEKSLFLYNEYPLASSTRLGPKSTGRPVTTFILTKGNQGQDKEVFIFHIREGGKGEFSEKKIPINLPTVSKITEVCISLQEERKSDFFNIEKIDRYNSLNEYKQGKSFFDGEWKNIPYPAELKETFDRTLESQHVPQSASVAPDSSKLGKAFDNYKGLLEKIGEGILPLNSLIEKEAHFQAVLHGAFSHYSDIKLGESQENRALVLTEFQTGRGKRIDMVVHGIKFADQASSAKEYDPVGLELKGPREGKTANALKDEANKQISDEYTKGVTYKTLTDGKEVDFVGVVFDKEASSGKSLIQLSNEKEFTPVKVVHSSIFSISQQQCSKGRKQRSTGMACIDSFDEEKITNEEKRKRVKELFGIESYDEKIITIDSPQVRIDGGKVNVKFKDNNGNDKELIIGNSANIQNIESYILDEKNLEIKLKVSSDKEYVIIEEIKEQGSEYYLKIDDYRIKLDSILQDGKEVIFDKLHQLSNDKQLLEDKKYIEDIGDIQTNQDYNNTVEEIKQNLLAKGVREDTFDRFKSHFDDLGEKVFADYIGNVESSLKEKGIAFDHDKFDSAKIKGAKGGKFFSFMAIYDLFDSIGDTATLGRYDNDALKQVFGINGILDAMDDVRTSLNISPNGKVGKLIGKIPGPARQAFVKVISNPVVQSITFATIAYQFGYSVNEIAQGNHHPLNYYWTASSGVKLASMSIRPISAGVSFTVKSVSATTKILRGLSIAGKVLGRVAVVTMVADVLITIGIEIHERIEYTKAIAEQVPLLPGGEQAEVFFAGVIKFFTGRDVEKEYEDTIRIKGYLNYVKEIAIRLLDDNYDIAAVVQYVTSIKEKYSEIIRYDGKGICSGFNVVFQCIEYCRLEEKYNHISFSQIGKASNVKNDLSLLDISKALPMIPYTLNMQGFECALPVLGSIFSPAGSFIANKCLQESHEKEKVYIVNTDAKHIPHLTKSEYENLGLRIVSVPLEKQVQEPSCSHIINKIDFPYGNNWKCNSDKVYKNCQRTIAFLDNPFIFTNPTRKDPSNTKRQTFPKGSVLYISGPKTLTAAANYPAVMHIPEGSDIRYVGSKNNETIFIINDHTSGILKGGAGKENTLVMNVKANNIVANLHGGTIRYGNSNNIRLVNTYNYVSNSDNKQNITTHCETRLINVKNAEVWQNSSNCTDKDYEVRVVNKENVHHRELKQTIFVVNEDSDNARIVSDLGSTEKIKESIDTIRVQVANVTQWGISEDIEKGVHSLDLLANNRQRTASSIKIDDFKNLVIQVNCHGITESVAIQDKSLSDTIEDIRYQKLKSSGSNVSREAIQNSKKKLKACIQASIIDQELTNTYQVAKDIANNSNFGIPVSQVEVIKNHMGVPNEKVIIAGMYSDQVIVVSYNNSEVTNSYQKYRNNGQGYGYDDYVMLCNYYQDITIEGEKGQRQYVIKLPDTLNSKIPSSPIRLNLKIKNKAVPYQSIPYNIIDFAELNVMDVDNISIQEGKRSYINACYNKSISDLTEDSLEIRDITILDSKGNKWSLSIGLVDYFQSPEHQQIVLQMNNELYKIDSTNLRLEHVEINPNSFRYYHPEEQGLQIYHNQPVNNHGVGLVDLKDKSILDFNMKVINDNLLLSHKNNTLVKVENWNTYQPAREMMFAFNDTTIANAKCIFSACNSEDIIGNFNKKKVNLLKDRVFNAIVQGNISEAEDLTRKIETIEGKRGLTPLYVAIQGGRLDVVKILFDGKHSSVQDKDIYSLYLAIQEGVDIGTKDSDGRTPSRTVAYNGNLDMVKFFLDGNMDIEFRNNNPYELMGIAESVEKKIINQAPNVKERAKSFVEKLRCSIKSVLQEKLKGGMLRDRYDSVNTLANGVYNFDQRLFNDTIKGVINDVYGKVDTKKILSCIASHNDINQRISGYVAVFETMQRNNNLNNSAIFKLSYSVKEIMGSDNYTSLDPERRSDLERLKGKLPKSVKNIVFASKVCITNIHFNEYLYPAYGLSDKDRRIVHTWVPSSRSNPPGSCGNDNQGMWRVQPYGDYVCITNVRFNEYLYPAYGLSDKDRRIVHTWVPSSRGNPPGSCGNDNQGMWKIQPYGNYVCITNVRFNEYLYPAYGLSDKDRRIVHTWVPSSRNNPPGSCGNDNQGMWSIEDCGSHVRKGRSKSAGTNTMDNNGGAFTDGSFNQSIIEPPVCDVSVNSHFGENINSTGENGLTPIHSAAWKGQLDDARLLIEKGAYIDAEDVFGRKPIHVAAENNNKNIIEFFLSKKVSVDDTDRYGRTPLYYASWNGYLDVVKYLIENGADINAQDKGGETSLDAATNQKHDNVEKYLKQVQLNKELLIAAQYGDLNEVEDLVNRNASLDAKYSNGWTLMHCAAYGGNLDIVKYFVADIKNSLEIKDNGGRVPLHYAAYNGKLDVVKYFIDEGKVDVNLKDSDGWTPLYYASCGHYLDVTKYLNEKHNPNLKKGSSALLETINSNNIEVQDKLGRTPLHLAAEVGDWNKVKLLCDYNANIEAQDNFGYTPILFATQSGKLSVVSLLLYYGANINAQGMYGSTPLHYAAQEGNLDMIQLLLSRCARIELLDRNGWTPMLLAAQESKWSAVKLLIDKGARFNNEITNQGTPLHFAVQEGNLNMVKFLLDKGADIESQNAHNEKPLHFAVKAGRLDILRLLLDRGANINATDMNGQTPSDLATQKGYSSIVEILRQAQLNLDKELLIAAEKGDLEKVRDSIRQGANVNVQGKQGWTPVFCAIQKNNFNIVELLLNSSADVKAKDNEGWTSLHWAVQLGELNVVERLVERGADVNALTADCRTPYDLAINQNYREIKEYLRSNSAVSSSMLIPHVILADDSVRQRKRRHHHGDHARRHMSRKPLAIDLSSQPEVAASSGTRPSSWINDLFSWVKSSVGGLFYSGAALPEETLNTTSSISQIDAPMDVNGTIMLLDVLVRKVTGQKYISIVDQSISPLEARGYALNIIEKFEKVLNETAIKSGISVTNLNFDPVAVQSAIVGQIISEKFSKIPKTLYSFAKEACPEFQQTDKFLAHLRSNLESEKEAILLQQKVEKPSKILDQQVSGKVELSKKPDTFLNGTSVVKGISNVLEL